MTNGILTDKGRNEQNITIARIDDKPYEVLPYVLPYLEKIVKGEKVEYQLKDGKLSRIEPANTQKPQGGTSAPCTSPTASPAASSGANNTGGPAAADGKVLNLDLTARKFTFRPDGGFAVDLVWAPRFDATMSKFKDGYKVKVTHDGKTLIDIKSGYVKGQGKGGNWQPRNEKLITYQCCYKEACETARALILQSSETMDEAEYHRVMDMALERAKKDAKALIDAAGGN